MHACMHAYVYARWFVVVYVGILVRSACMCVFSCCKNRCDIRTESVCFVDKKKSTPCMLYSVCVCAMCVYNICCVCCLFLLTRLPIYVELPLIANVQYMLTYVHITLHCAAYSKIKRRKRERESEEKTPFENISTTKVQLNMHKLLRTIWSCSRIKCTHTHIKLHNIFG